MPIGEPFTAKNTPTTAVSSLDVAVSVTTPESTAPVCGETKSTTGVFISEGVPVPLTNNFTPSV